MKLEGIFKSFKTILLSSAFLIPNQYSLIQQIDSPTHTNEVAAIQAVEQIKNIESETLPQINDTFEHANTYVSAKTPVARQVSYQQSTPQPAATPKPLSNGISVAGRTIPTFISSSTTIDAGNSVGIYGHLYYGHNTSNVFGGLKTLGIGSTFTITTNGASVTYRVDHIETMERDAVKNYMRAITTGRFRGGSYDAILMTCAGTSLGNGEATHRLMIFANPV